MCLLAVAGCTLFTSLGFWQWHRGQYRQGLWAQFEADASVQREISDSAQLAGAARYARIRVTGRLDGAHQLLLDNRSREGRPGYELLTPLILPDGAVLLVNRGWLPFTGYRDRLPDVGLPENPAQALTGRLDQLPVAGLAAGRVPPPAAGPWPRLTSFPTAADLSQVLGRRVPNQVLLLDADSGPGFERHWLPPGVEPARNYSYAIQWWAFAALTLGLFLFLNLEKRR